MDMISRIKSNLKSKAGMTLVEAMVALIISLIVIGITGGLIISSSTLFGHAADRDLDQKIATTVLGFVRDEITYATVVNTPGAVSSAAPDDGLIYCTDKISGTPTVSADGIGQLAYKRPGDDSAAINAYGSDFYHGREISLKISRMSSDPMVVKIYVEIYRDGEVVFKDDNTAKLANLTDSDLLNIAANEPYPAGDKPLIIAYH